MWNIIKDWWMGIKEWFMNIISPPTVEEKISFVDSLAAKGFVYQEDNGWWQRTWIAQTRDFGEESCLEVYKHDVETDEWSSIMYGSEGELFFEEKLGKK